MTWRLPHRLLWGTSRTVLTIIWLLRRSIMARLWPRLGRPQGAVSFIASQILPTGVRKYRRLRLSRTCLKVSENPGCTSTHFGGCAPRRLAPSWWWCCWTCFGPWDWHAIPTFRGSLVSFQKPRTTAGTPPHFRRPQTGRTEPGAGRGRSAQQHPDRTRDQLVTSRWLRCPLFGIAESL